MIEINCVFFSLENVSPLRFIIYLSHYTEYQKKIKVLKRENMSASSLFLSNGEVFPGLELGVNLFNGSLASGVGSVAPQGGIVAIGRKDKVVFNVGGQVGRVLVGEDDQRSEDDGWVLDTGERREVVAGERLVESVLDQLFTVGVNVHSNVGEDTADANVVGLSGVRVDELTSASQSNVGTFERHFLVSFYLGVVTERQSVACVVLGREVKVGNVLQHDGNTTGSQVIPATLVERVLNDATWHANHGETIDENSVVSSAIHGVLSGEVERVEDVGHDLLSLCFDVGQECTDNDE